MTWENMPADEGTDSFSAAFFAQPWKARLEREKTLDVPAADQVLIPRKDDDGHYGGPDPPTKGYKITGSLTPDAAGRYQRKGTVNDEPAFKRLTRGTTCTVTGSLTPDASGTYHQNGTYTYLNTWAYQRADGAYWLWFDNVEDRWKLTIGLGIEEAADEDAADPVWLGPLEPEPGRESVSGEYAAGEGATGTATIKNGEYWIWYDDDSSTWKISTGPEEADPFVVWEGGADLVGEYTAGDGATGAATVAEDETVPRRFSFYDMHKWVEETCSSFRATIDSGLNPVTDYDGKTSVERWSWPKMLDRVFAPAGLGGWTAKKLAGTWGHVLPYPVGSGTEISFETNKIKDSGNRFVGRGYQVDDEIEVQASTSNNGFYRILDVAAGEITVAAGITEEDGLPATRVRHIKVEYRRAAVGDLRGSWLWNDLRLPLAEMIQTFHAVVLVLSGYKAESAEYAWPGGGNYNDAQAAARDDADVAYGADGSPGSDLRCVSSEEDSQGDWDWWGDYIARLYRTEGQMQVTAPAHCKRAVDWYFYWTGTHGVGRYDNNGDPINDASYTKWSTDAATADATVTSAATFGDKTAKPNWVTGVGVVLPVHDWPVSRGYTLTLPAAMLRWDVVGGYEYV